jgi:hypothetical protein
MPEHPCPNNKIIEKHGEDIGVLFEKLNRTVERMGEIETTLFGAERNGGGFFKSHERLHEEENMALKETLEVVQLGMKTISEQQHEQGKRISKLLDKGRFAREMAKLAAAAALPVAASILIPRLFP